MGREINWNVRTDEARTIERWARIYDLTGRQRERGMDMNAVQAREVFNRAVIGETDPDRIARVELLREYFCNSKFRKEMETNMYCPRGYDECWQGCAYPGRCYK